MKVQLRSAIRFLGDTRTLALPDSVTGPLIVRPTGVQYALMSSPATRQIMDPLEAHTLDASEGRRSMGAFLVSGMLVSFLGAILPAWRYHLRADFREVGAYFLSLNLGFLLSAGAAHFLLPRKGVKFVL